MRAVTVWRVWRPLVCGFALLWLAPACAGPQRSTPITGGPLADHPRVALLTLENLSGAPDAGESLTRLLGAEITARGLCELVDIGQVQGTLRRLRVRNTAVLSLDQLHSLGDSLGVRFVLTGSVLEHGTISTEDGPIPTVGAALKLIDVTSGRVTWAKSRSFTGKDRETVFGYGREIDPGRLDARLVDDLLVDLARLGGVRPAKAMEGKQP
jgi:TolB-like protein